MKFTKHTFRFKRGGRGFKGGPDRIGLGFEEGNSKTNTSSSDPLPEYLTSNSSVKTRTDVSGKYNYSDHSLLFALYSMKTGQEYSFVISNVYQTNFR